MKARVLIIAGSDSGGGAGIQADIKTVTALGGFAMTAVTALTAQNTRGVFAIHEVPPEFVARQIEVVLDDLGADCVKIGMLHRPEIIEAVRGALEGTGLPVVVDPVMVAKGGHALLEPDAVESLKTHIIPMATVLTPNLPEAEALSGGKASDRAGAGEVAGRLAALGARAVLLKGGHAPGQTVTDLLFEGERLVEAFSSPRIETTSTHGTGCTLASAIAVGIAQGLDLRAAVARARAYVREAIRAAPGLGGGHGPLGHGHTVKPFEGS